MLLISLVVYIRSCDTYQPAFNFNFLVVEQQFRLKELMFSIKRVRLYTTVYLIYQPAFVELPMKFILLFELIKCMMRPIIKVNNEY